MVSDEYRPYIGGAGRCIELFAEELVRLGHKVAIATAWHSDAPAFEQAGGVEIHRIRDLPSRMRWISEDPRRHTPPPFPDPEAVWQWGFIERVSTGLYVTSFGAERVGRPVLGTAQHLLG